MSTRIQKYTIGLVTWDISPPSSVRAAILGSAGTVIAIIDKTEKKPILENQTLPTRTYSTLMPPSSLAC
nr:hypothetical protein [Candidatus Sigynarchaeota archaeon]